MAGPSFSEHRHDKLHRSCHDKEDGEDQTDTTRQLIVGGFLIYRKIKISFVSCAESLCVECERHPPLGAATEVDHILPIEDGGAMYDEENLQPLCKPHHSRKTARDKANPPPRLFTDGGGTKGCVSRTLEDGRGTRRTGNARLSTAGRGGRKSTTLSP